jgi:hypothetical protein
MKNYLILLCLMFYLNVYSQTESIENQNLSSRYSEEKSDQASYAKLSKEWADLIEALGGYPLLPFNDETKEIEFKSIKSFSNVDIKTIYDRIMEWTAMNFGTLTSVLHYSNFENGKIIIQGWFNVYYKTYFKAFFTSKKEKVSSARCNFSFFLTIKENRLKMEIVDINYEYYIPYYLAGNTYIPSYTKESSIASLFPVTNSESVEWKGRLDLLNKTSIKINSFFNDLELYIKNKSIDYNF